MKYPLHKWMLAGLLVTMMLATAVVPALAQENTSSDAGLAQSLTLGMVLLGILALIGVGLFAYVNDNNNGGS